MGSGLKNFGLISGVIAFAACAVGGVMLIANPDLSEQAMGIIAIGFGVYAGATLALGVLRDQSAVKPTQVLAKPAKKAKAAVPQVKKTEPAKSSKKQAPVAKSETTKEEGTVSIYAGSLPYEAGQDEIRSAFEAFGTVSSVRIVIDKPTGKSKGYGFVEMPVKEEALAAIEGLNGREFSGKKLKVNEAKPTARRPRNRRPNRQTSEKVQTPEKLQTPDKREAEMVDWDA